jgi:hypothetical protein
MSRDVIMSRDAIISRDEMMSRDASNSSNARNSNSRNANNSKNAGNSSDTEIARTPVKGGTAIVQATLWKLRYTNNNSVPVCHKSIDASNSRTPKQQQGISVMPLTSWMQATARK